MPSRALELIHMVEDMPGISAEKLANLLGVSERTIRSSVRQANEFMAGSAHIHHRRNDGYELLIDDEEALAALLGRVPASTLPTLPDERVAYVLYDLLSRNDWVTVDTLAETLCVSRASVSSDLRQVEERLGRYGLSIARRPRYGIRVEGTEEARRLCLANTLLTSDRAHNQTLTGLPDLQEARVAACVDSALQAAQFSMNPAAHLNLIVHVAVALYRAGKGSFVPETSTAGAPDKDSAAYKAAIKLVEAVEREFALKLPASEVSYIATHLAGRQVVEGEVAEEMGMVISDEVWAVVDMMLVVVRGAFGIDFLGNLELRMNLARHIAPLGIRLRNHLHMQNPLLSEIKDHYPLAFSMARSASSALLREYGEFPSEDELGYLALPFALALERQKMAPAPKNILIVCAAGRGSAKLLEQSYRDIFGEWLDVIRTCDVRQVSTANLSDIDYVFTTVPLPTQLPVPVRQVKFFLDDSDILDLKHLLSKPAAAEVSSVEYFSQDLFFTHLSFANKSEALDYLCDKVMSHRFIDGPLRELVEQREQLAETCFGNRVAMPHPIEPISDETFVCVTLLDSPLCWNEKEVRAIFLVCVTRADETLEDFYRILTPILASESAIDELVANQSWETLTNLVKRISQETDVSKRKD